MVLTFLKDCTDATGKTHKKGDVTNVAKCIARGLLGAGSAEAHQAAPPPPTMTKPKSKREGD